MSKIEYTWQSTPQLWLASRLDGCPCPEHFKYGMGRTKEEALAKLLEQDDESESFGDGEQAKEFK